jgi:iron complex outermembrane receptor protein
MFTLHKYKDDKKYETARGVTTKNEIWDQNGAKGEYRTSFDAFAMMAGFDIQSNKTDELSHDTADGIAPRGGADGDLLSDYATDELINALYTELIFRATDNLTTTFNVRYDNIKHKYVDNTDTTKDVTPSYDVGSYRAGVNYTLTPRSALYASVSTGFRTPTVTQISRNAEALKVDPTLDIPAEMDIETTYNYELGLRGKYEDLTYNASVFQLDRQNYIGVIAGSYITSDDPDESNYDNVGDMRSRGFELAVGSKKDEMVSFDLAYTYLDAKFTSYSLSQQMTVDPDGPYRPLTATYQRVDLSGNQVPRTSKHTLNLRVDYRPIQKLTLTPELIVKSDYYADEVNAHKESGYEVVNLRAEYRYNESLEIFAKIDNVLNRNYYEFVNINSSALATMEDDATIRVAAPTSYYAGLRYRF